MCFSLSVVSDSAAPWTVDRQALLSMEFSRQEYWCWLPFLSPGDLSNPGTEPGSPELQPDSLPSEPPGKTHTNLLKLKPTLRKTELNCSRLRRGHLVEAPHLPISEICGFSELKLGAGFGLALFHGASLVAQLVKNLPAMGETWVRSLSWEDPPGEEKGYPLQYSGLENSVDHIVHGVAKSQTRPSNFHFTSSLLGHAVPSGCLVGPCSKVGHAGAARHSEGVQGAVIWSPT